MSSIFLSAFHLFGDVSHSLTSCTNPGGKSRENCFLVDLSSSVGLSSRLCSSSVTISFEVNPLFSSLRSANPTTSPPSSPSSVTHHVVICITLTHHCLKFNSKGDKILGNFHQLKGVRNCHTAQCLLTLLINLPNS